MAGPCQVIKRLLTGCVHIPLLNSFLMESSKSNSLQTLNYILSLKGENPSCPMRFIQSDMVGWIKFLCHLNQSVFILEIVLNFKVKMQISLSISDYVVIMATVYDSDWLLLFIIEKLRLLA